MHDDTDDGLDWERGYARCRTCLEPAEECRCEWDAYLEAGQADGDEEPEHVLPQVVTTTRRAA